MYEYKVSGQYTGTISIFNILAHSVSIVVYWSRTIQCKQIRVECLISDSSVITPNPLEEIRQYFVGEDGIEPTEHFRAADLQSAPLPSTGYSPITGYLFSFSNKSFLRLL